MATPRPEDEQLTQTSVEGEQVTVDSDDLEQSGDDPTIDRLQKLEAHRPTDPRYRSVDEIGRGGMGVVLLFLDGSVRDWRYVNPN